MIQINITGADVAVTQTETLTAGRVGLECGFTFDSAWDGLNKIAVCEGAETKAVVMEPGNDTIVVPWECLADPGYKLRIGVRGENASGDIVIPTVWARVGKIADSPDDDVDPGQEATPSVVQQIQETAANALYIARGVKAEADSGAFNGQDGQDGADGTDGADGVSPTVSTEITYYGNKVTFTDANGDHSINVLDGMTATVKSALLNLFQHVAYVDDQGQTYYDALYDAFNPVLNMDYITVVFDPGAAVIYNTYELAQLRPYITCTAHYDDGTSAEVDTYTLSGTLAAGTDTITVTYGGKSAIFTVTVVEWLTSITSVFTQDGAAIYDADSLDTLKQYLTVTANFADGTTATVTDYTLSGALTVGASTITASYGGKTDTFSVTVTAWTLQWSVEDGGLPTAVAPNDWQSSQTTDSNHSVTFDQTNGIIWVGKAGNYNIWPTNYTTASNSVLEIIVNFKTISSITDIMIFLASANDSLIAMLYSDGIHVNYAADPAIDGTAFATNMDYVLRLERTSTNGKITLNNTLIYNGEIRTGRSDTNKITLTTTGAGSAWEGYIKAIRYWEG